VLEDPRQPPGLTGTIPQAHTLSGSSPGWIRSHFVASVDLEEIFANIPKWQIDHQTLTRPTSASYSEMVIVGSTAITSELLNGRVQTRAELPRGHIAMGVDMAGVFGRQFGGRALGGDDALIGYDRAELDYLLAPGFLGLSITMPGRNLEAALDARFDGRTGLEHYRSVRATTVDRARYAHAWRFFGRLMELLRTSRESHQQGAMRPDFLETEIIDVMASIVGAHRHVDTEKRSVLWSQRRPVVRRAEQFMRDHIAEPIGLHDICVAARASERTVEYAFKEMYGLGAKKFLQILRLNEARRLFRVSQGAIVSVQDIAAATGFWHMGHFSANYRRLFGEAPTETIRRSR